MNACRPSGSVRLEPDWALQDPNDYIEVFKQPSPQCSRPAVSAPPT